MCIWTKKEAVRQPMDSRMILQGMVFLIVDGMCEVIADEKRRQTKGF